MGRKKIEPVAEDASGEQETPKTGGAYLKARGLKGVVLGLTPDEHATLVRAAAVTTGEARGLAKYIVVQALAAARRDLASAGLDPDNPTGKKTQQS